MWRYSMAFTGMLCRFTKLVVEKTFPKELKKG